MNKKTDERRKQERKTLVAYTQVFDLYGGNLLGYLGDLTVSGAMIISEKAMKPDTDITLAIEMPELPDIKVVRMSMTARVVWCQQDLSPQYFNIGFEFKEVKDEHKKLIETIIQNYQFRRDVPIYPQRGPVVK
ncbi:MAG: PilZ domain-containing protein [Anaerolineales bacterium]|nr:PilZ domain-containing protein [Anaerolineales bacterium]MCB9144946.1 PilZ domain-containing protein [Anaerolineales bacterium]